MSLLKRSKYTKSNMHFLMEAVANPANRLALQEAQNQHVVLNKIRQHASDLFEPNAAVESNIDGQKTFHSSQLYKMNSSAEELMQAMDEYDVCLRCNAVKDGGATAVQIGRKELSSAIGNASKSVDIQAGKNAQLRLFLEKRGGLHYIRKLDYVIN